MMMAGCYDDDRMLLRQDVMTMTGCYDDGRMLL
jgi:hypothetical protein